MLATLLLATVFALDLAPTIKAHDVPALAVVAVNGAGEVQLQSHAGITFEGGEPVDADSRWHVGSCTKSITALLAATCVRDGLLDWDTRAGDVLDDLAEKPLGEATLLQLLTHTAGTAPVLDHMLIVGPPSKDELRRQRRIWLKHTGGDAATPPGEAFRYSNAGYIIAGMMVEQVTERSWEQAINSRVFEPLGVKTFGFGAPPEGHPRGHLGDESIDPASPNSDNRPILAPAGTVHMSARDFAIMAAVHLRDSVAERLKIADEDWAVLHKAKLDDYAPGLVVAKRPWGGGTVFTHDGSNTLWYATMWIAPEKDIAIVACSNAFAPEAVNEAIVLALREIELIE
ncbi:MAG: serine hydrolase domain-containing protein [Planctomycetota bacterium]